jgi:hypothetical protein
VPFVPEATASRVCVNSVHVLGLSDGTVIVKVADTYCLLLVPPPMSSDPEMGVPFTLLVGGQLSFW